MQVSIQPNYSPTGRKSGWRVTHGTQQSSAKSQRGAGSKATKVLQAHFASGGTSATYVIYDSAGKKHSTTVYRRNSAGVIVSNTETHKGTTDAPAAKKATVKRRKAAKKSTATKAAAPKKAAAPRKAKASSKKKASAKKKTAAKKTRGAKKLNSGLKAYQSFIKAQKAAGKTHAQAVAAWASKSAGTAKKASKPKRKKATAKKAAASTTVKAPTKRKATKRKTTKRKASKRTSAAAATKKAATRKPAKRKAAKRKSASKSKGVSPLPPI